VKLLQPQQEWPQSWKDSYAYDREEIYGDVSNRGYALAYENRWRLTLRLVTDVLEPGARILDLAAAQGNFSLALAEMDYDVTWNDLREELAEYVRLKYERGRIQFEPGNVFDLEFPHSFDAVLLTEVIEHVAHPDQLLEKIANFVRPGGYIILTTPNGAYFRNGLPKFSECADPTVYEIAQFKPDADGHIFLLHPDEIRALAARANLNVDVMHLFTNPLTAGHMKMEQLLRVFPRRWIDKFEAAARQLPAPIKRKALVQIAVRLQKPVAG
jgi:2-polyprenyl-6-hydroxyphenyl methylase/3-demethylubiquinone-9 3-methyltransferase